MYIYFYFSSLRYKKFIRYTRIIVLIGFILSVKIYNNLLRILSGSPKIRFISNFVLSMYVLSEFTVQYLTGNINKSISTLQANYKLCPDDAKSKGLYAVLCICCPQNKSFRKSLKNKVVYS